MVTAESVVRTQLIHVVLGFIQPACYLAKRLSNRFGAGQVLLHPPHALCLLRVVLVARSLAQGNLVGQSHIEAVGSVFEENLVKDVDGDRTGALLEEGLSGFPSHTTAPHSQGSWVLCNGGCMGTKPTTSDILINDPASFKLLHLKASHGNSM